jgi:uncharacterized protein (TIGR00299 family) protein
MKTLYLNNYSGISGDILLSALLQCLSLEDELNDLLSKILKFPVQLSLENFCINGIVAKRLNIFTKVECKQTYRNVYDIYALLDSSPIDDQTKIDAKAVFNLLAEAESYVHNVPRDAVHFHELGAIDTIIDIVGVSFLINRLKPVKIISSPLKIGCGFIDTSHGLLPNPAPATMYLLKDMSFEKMNIERELTTPTGAALIKYFAKMVVRNYNGVLKNVYYSTGTNVFESIPNLFCLCLCDEENDENESIVELETNIDDMPGINFSYVQAELLKAGALDCYFEPIFTKKSRPAYKLSVLCYKNILSRISDIIFSNTTTAGIRFVEKSRFILHREINTIEYQGYKIRVKSLFYKDRIKKMPEWQDIEDVAMKLHMPPYALYTKILEIV